jgi:hypothetical protein
MEADDARHDEALASRIAALNMVELSLDHLGLITRPENVRKEEANVISTGLHRIVEKIGDGESSIVCIRGWLTVV